MAAMTRRQHLGIGAALGAGLLAAACDIVPAGVPQAPQDSQDRPVAPKRPDPGLPRQTQRQVPIRVRYSAGEGYSAAWNMDQFRQYTAPFTEAHPHLTIEWQTWSEVPGMYQALWEAVDSGQAVDVFQDQDIVQVPWWAWDPVPLVTQGAFLGLNQFVRRDRYDLTDFWPGALEYTTWRGELYGLHTHADTQLVFYNPELLTASGVSAPASDWTWQHLLDHARALTGHRGGKPVYGFALSHNYGFPLTWSREGRNFPATIPWIWANGGDIVDADLATSLVDEPPAREALEWLFEQRDTHAVWPPADEVSGDDLFKIGQLAMLYGPRSLTGQLLVPQAEYGLKYGLAAAPHGPVKPANWLFLQSAFHLGAATSVPDEAWTFLSWWAGEEAQRAFQQGTVRKGRVPLPTLPPPARRSVAQSVAPYFGGDAIVPALEHARNLPLHPARVKLLQAFEAGMAPVWAGTQSVAEATAAIAKAQNAILAG